MMRATPTQMQMARSAQMVMPEMAVAPAQIYEEGEIDDDEEEEDDYERKEMMDGGEGEAVAVCIKAANLRKMTPKSYDNLIAWMADPQNVYVGRGERVGIKDPVTGRKFVQGIKGSKWANPFKVKDHGLKKALELYRQHLFAVRKDGTKLVDSIAELRGKKLGCWCNQKEPCHAQILADTLKRLKRS